jgi:hypothetical protein
LGIPPFWSVNSDRRGRLFFPNKALFWPFRNRAGPISPHTQIKDMNFQRFQIVHRV